MKTKKLQLLFVVFSFFYMGNINAQALVFSQEFAGGQAEVPVNTIGEIPVGEYVNTTNPNSSQLTSISVGSRQSSSFVDINRTTSGNFHAQDGGTSFMWDITRNVDVENPVPSALMFKMRSKHDVTSSGSASTVVCLGSGLSNGTTKPANASVHSGFMFRPENSAGTMLYDYSGSNQLTPRLTAQEAVYVEWTFVVNNSGSEISYTAPTGVEEDLANDAWDLWADNTKLLNDQPAVTATTNIGQFKIAKVASNGRILWDIDYIKIYDVGLPRLDPPVVDDATNVTNSGFTAHWQSVAGATGYTVNVYNGSTLITSYPISNPATLTQIVTGLPSPNTTYTYKVIAKGDGITKGDSKESVGKDVRTLSSEKQITTFKLLGATGTMDHTAKTVSVVVPFSADLTAPITPDEVTVSQYATLLTVGAQTFFIGLPGTTYTVQAEDGSTQDYSVILSRAPASKENYITKFTFGNLVTDEQVSINGDLITIKVPCGQTPVYPTELFMGTNVEVSPLATVTSLLTSLNFANDAIPPVTIVVQAEDPDPAYARTYSFHIEEDCDAPLLDATTINGVKVETDPITGVSLSGKIVMTFNENVRLIDPATIQSKVSLTGGAATIGTVQVKDKTVTIPFSGLIKETNYTFTLQDGTIEDLFGNDYVPVSSPYSFSFTTANDMLEFPLANGGSYISEMNGGEFIQPAFITFNGSAAIYDETAPGKIYNSLACKGTPGAYVLDNTNNVMTIKANRVGKVKILCAAAGSRSLIIRANSLTEYIDWISAPVPTKNKLNRCDSDAGGILVVNSPNETQIKIELVNGGTGSGTTYIYAIEISDYGEDLQNNRTDDPRVRSEMIAKVR